MRLWGVDDVPALEGRRVDVEGFYIGVFNAEEGFFAVYDVCSYRRPALGRGMSQAPW